MTDFLISSSVEIIKSIFTYSHNSLLLTKPFFLDSLYFLNVDENFKPPQSDRYLFFTTDNTLVYTAFFADFGPLNLGLTYQFCQLLENHLKLNSSNSKIVVYYCANHPHRRANSAVLLVAYLVHLLNNNTTSYI